MIRTFFVRLVAFSLFFAILYTATVFLLANWQTGAYSALQGILGTRVQAGNEGYTLARFREIGDYDNIDVLFVGSSHVYRSFDTALFAREGLKTFNMGSSSQTPMNSYYLLEKYFFQLRPKLVVMEVYWEVLEIKDGLESFYDLSMSLPASAEMVKMAVATRNPQALNFLAGVYLQRLVTPLGKQGQREYPGQLYVQGGYVESRETINLKTANFSPQRTIKLADRQLEYLRDIINLAKENNAKIVIVVQPVPWQLLATITNYWEVSVELREVADRAGVAYWDFNELMALDSERDFRDKDHLNYRGVEKFNRQLLDRLRQEELL